MCLPLEEEAVAELNEAEYVLAAGALSTAVGDVCRSDAASICFDEGSCVFSLRDWLVGVESFGPSGGESSSTGDSIIGLGSLPPTKYDALGGYF